MRLLKLFIITSLCLFSLTWALAQEPPPPTPVEITPEAPIDPITQPPVQPSETTLLLAARSDLENLVNATRAGVRPDGWTGAIDISDPNLALLIRLDLELLAGALVGANFRPDGWFGVIASTNFAIARDIRHDLELLAETILGATRPTGWVGSEPLLRCDRTTQALVRLLELNGVFALQADRTAPDFCARAAREASVFVEVNYLATGTAVGERISPNVVGATGGETVNSNFAVGFFDTSAIGRAGVIPNGTTVRPLARSYTQFSNMMLIGGNGFVVFIDYLFTTVTDDMFEALPNVTTIEYSVSCAADWCS
ncbi:MAG: hypothetical protein SH821_04890 [Phototrophicales bacterium]|nr:hypothetical protein [Phototrophicales bacterium]